MPAFRAQGSHPVDLFGRDSPASCQYRNREAIIYSLSFSCWFPQLESGHRDVHASVKPEFERRGLGVFAGERPM